MIQKIKNILLIGLLLVTAFVIARDYGRYKCPTCSITMSPAEVRAFIGVFVNPNVSMWAANDTVSICDGTTCTQYLTPNQGVLWSPKLKYPDPGIDYKGEGQPLADGGGLDPNPGNAGAPGSGGFVDPVPVGVVTVGNIYPDGFFNEPICNMISDTGINGC
ncbi:hypothetical protein [Acidovorax sp. NCPPB 3576]|uniref:hypothetical protein n=1 Tax=Acidovorax sp. NCPPB 3576 TaxID=2940488 RepID=UPI00234AB866|nr:hypothetical protein [Acidovorax sp. NCPPB 3576]WCM90437.1 hypothetical protein M5C98_10655 [Acidovorax sp. NCPPB 3576]